MSHESRRNKSMPVDNELYNSLSSTWWDENEPLNLLRTSLNPGRFGYFRDVLNQQLRIDPRGKKVLDVGCGGGILAEEFARLGCQVMGIDPSASSLATARAHAQQAGLDIDYRVGAGEDLPFADESFEVVCSSDVLEHVRDLEKVISEIARVLKQDGVFLYDTINRTFPSNLVMIKLVQEWKSTSFMPPNLHDWNAFIKPRELLALLMRYGLDNREITGLKPGTNPIAMTILMRKRKRGEISLYEMGSRMSFQQSKDTSILYMGYAIKAG
jgi:2-polyprenyl-6-hydroxyphenyl methylase / 3-demethylubiquinone-9 3-methyltransferase